MGHITLLEILIAMVLLAVPDILNKWRGRKECAKRCVQDPLDPPKYKRCPMWDCYAYEHCPHGGLYGKIEYNKEPPQ